MLLGSVNSKTTKALFVVCVTVDPTLQRWYTLSGIVSPKLSISDKRVAPRLLELNIRPDMMLIRRLL